jgi:hypothetical protein
MQEWSSQVHEETASSSKHSKYILFLLLFRCFGACLDDGPLSWALAMMSDVRVQAGRPFESVDVFVNNFLAEEIQVEVVLTSGKG